MGSLVTVRLGLALLIASSAFAATTNTTIRVMASNLSSGNYQRYESPGLDILKGLKPDIVAMQEFNYASATYGTNTTAALREMIDNTFGTNFVYFRQSGSGISIPNGIISRYPILSSGVWDDTLLPDRDFVWAQIDIPGTNDLYVVSVHLKASSSSASTRASEASTLKGLIQANFPANAFIVVAGDCNLYSTGEACYTTMTSYLVDSPVPTDATSGGDADTNAGRSERYDYVFVSSGLAAIQVPSVIGAHTFNNGLVFDSRVYTPLSEVSPVQSTDSGATGMQHMGVIKDFKVTYTVGDTITSPQLAISSPSVLTWQGQPNTTYSVQLSTDLLTWPTTFSVSSATSTFSFTNPSPDAAQTFYRVTYP